MVWDYGNTYLFFFADLMVFVAVVLLLLLFEITVSFRFRFGRRTRTRRAFKGWKGTGTHLILIYKKKMKISYERKFPLAGLLFPLVVISHGTFKSLDKSWNFSRLESLTKGQLISKANFKVFIWTKKQWKYFCISAQAFKSSWIKKI